MSLLVQKYGGTSVGNPERIKNVARRVVETAERGHQVVVVVSAMGDTTDELLDKARQITDDPCPRELDMLLTTGEQISIALLAMAVQKQGAKSVSLTGGLAGIHTESLHGKARITSIDPTRIHHELEQGNIVIVAGFQGIAEDGSLTTLGRGGSDTTAVALAGALGADACEIYTDVDGVYTADPRVVKTARKMDAISYEEMLELANLGAGVLHPRAVEAAKKYQVPVVVRSSFTEESGTRIVREVSGGSGHLIRGIAHDTELIKINLFGVQTGSDSYRTVFQALAEAAVNVDLIVTTAGTSRNLDLSFTVAQTDRLRAEQVLHTLLPAIGQPVLTIEERIAKVSVVGSGMIGEAGVAAQVFAVLADNGVTMSMVSTSEMKISCIIDSGQVGQVIQVLHSAFGLDGVQEAIVYG